MDTGLYSVSRNFSGWFTHSSGCSTWDTHHTWETTLASYTGRFSFTTSLYLISLRFPGVRFKCTPSWWSCELNQPKRCIHSPESSVLLADVEQSHKAMAICLAAPGGWRAQQENNFTVAKHRTCSCCPFTASQGSPKTTSPFNRSPGWQVSPGKSNAPASVHKGAWGVQEVSESLSGWQSRVSSCAWPGLTPLLFMVLSWNPLLCFRFQCLWPWCRGFCPENINICTLKLMRKTLLLYLGPLNSSC